MRPRLIPFEKPAALEGLATSGTASYSFIDIKKTSRWFDQLVVAGLPPNGVETTAYPDDGSETFYLFSSFATPPTFPSARPRTFGCCVSARSTGSSSRRRG